MDAQVDRMFNPTQLPEDHPLSLKLNKTDFPSMVHEALRQEIADQKGDWEIPNLPEIPVVDGTNRVAEENTTNVVDEAVQALAKAQGRKPPPTPEPSERPADPPPADPIPAEEVRSEERHAPEKPPEPEPTPETHKTNPSPASDPPKAPAQNTEMPSEGIMLEGEVPTTEPVEKRVVDPWAPSEDKKIPVGGTVVLGGGGGGNKKDG